MLPWTQSPESEFIPTGTTLQTRLNMMLKILQTAKERVWWKHRRTRAQPTSDAFIVCLLHHYREQTLPNSWKHIHYRHLRSHHQDPIRSEPERGGSRRFAHVPLCVWEQLSGMRRQRTEGVIKLKRLGEDELPRSQESRHWLYNSNPVQSASTQADCDERTRTEPVHSDQTELGHWSSGREFRRQNAAKTPRLLSSSARALHSQCQRPETVGLLLTMHNP